MRQHNGSKSTAAQQHFTLMLWRNRPMRRHHHQPREWQTSLPAIQTVENRPTQTAVIQYFALLLGGISFSVLVGTILPSPSLASHKPPLSKTAVLQYKPPIPPNLGAPRGRTGGGASRGGCSDGQVMQALLPQSASHAFDLTASGHPTLWFYLPERSHPETRLEFVVQDSADEYIYKTVVDQPNHSAGLVSITLPEQSPALVSGAMYHWTLSLYCDPKRPSQMTFIRGALQKVAIAPHSSTPLSANLSTPQDLEATARLYAQQGLWNDAITLLAQALQAQSVSQSTTQLWKDLLGQSGLTEPQLPPIAARRSSVIPIGTTALIPLAD